MTVGERMRALRKDRGISADKVAEILGVSRSTIFRYEKGDIDKVPAEQLESIASALKTNVGYLLGWTNNSAPGMYECQRDKVCKEYTQGERELIELYRRADEADRLAVNLILQKYADPEVTIPASAG
mgnify:CR=1 FL=1